MHNTKDMGQQVSRKDYKRAPWPPAVDCTRGPAPLARPGGVLSFLYVSGGRLDGYAGCAIGAWAFRRVRRVCNRGVGV